MELTERKIKILNSIIQTYLMTGEPVGSRTISKYTDLHLSSATIRNEMSDLEDMGYIVQPHTSAGRIPSDKGYRFYVDNLMQEKIAEVEEMKEPIIKREEKMEQMLQKIAKMLAVNTNYASMITAPTYKRNKIRFIQLTRVIQNQMLVVVMLEGEMIKNKLIVVDDPVEEEDVAKLNILLNTFLQGLTLSEISLELIQRMKQEADEYASVIANVVDALAMLIQEADDLEVYTSGATNLLKYPELGDREQASQLLCTMEEKRALGEMIVDAVSDDGKHPIQVYIGAEAPVSTMKDCSIVTATYEIEEGVQGTIGIIGPKRMDYKKVVGNLQTVMNQLDDIFKNK